jgi:hypothetical protein
MNRSKIIDNLRLHTRAGTLSSEASMRARPRIPIVSDLTPIEKPRVHIQWLYSAINTSQLRSVLLAKAYSAFYPEPMESVSPFALMGALGSMFTNMIPPRLVNQDGQLNDAFNSAGMELVS